MTYEENLTKQYGLTDDYADAGWILRNGQFVDLNRSYPLEEEILDTENLSLAEYEGPEGITHEESLIESGIQLNRDEFTAKTGVIRVNHKGDYTDIVYSLDVPPTNEQYQSLTKLARNKEGIIFDAVTTENLVPHHDVEIRYNGEFPSDVLQEMPISRAFRIFRSKSV